ncbi:hypothetical protein evm_007916 [Chilo suppressalis]|nr:hypothetical protein evm_007916 [Chilo suppressalis]
MSGNTKLMYISSSAVIEFQLWNSFPFVFFIDDVYGRTASITGKSECRIVNEGFKNDGKFETLEKTGKADQRKKWSHKEPWLMLLVKIPIINFTNCKFTNCFSK